PTALLLPSCGDHRRPAACRRSRLRSGRSGRLPVRSPSPRGDSHEPPRESLLERSEPASVRRPSPEAAAPPTANQQEGPSICDLVPVVTFDAEDDHRYKILEEEEGQRVCHPRLGARPGLRLPHGAFLPQRPEQQGSCHPSDRRRQAAGPSRAADLAPTNLTGTGCTSMNMVNAPMKPCGWPARRYGRAHEEWPEAAPMG